MVDSASPGMLRSQDRSWVRVVALLLVLLAASPVTAPFSTLDLNLSSPSPAVDASKSKGSDDDIVDGSAAFSGVTAVDTRSTPVRPFPRVQQPRESRPVVLRL